MGGCGWVACAHLVCGCGSVCAWQEPRVGAPTSAQLHLAPAGHTARLACSAVCPQFVHLALRIATLCCCRAEDMASGYSFMRSGGVDVGKKCLWKCVETCGNVCGLGVFRVLQGGGRGLGVQLHEVWWG